MAHDYATQNNAQKNEAMNTNRTIPAWVLLFIGMATGIFVSFLFYLTKLPPITEATVNSTNTSSSANQNTKEPEKAFKFDFYTLLPESEVLVPMVEEYSSNSQQEPQNIRYFLQAGSFQNNNDADQLRATLILLGLDAKIETVTVSDAKWHRVQVGPYTARAALNKVQDVLIDNNIETLVLKKSD